MILAAVLANVGLILLLDHYPTLAVFLVILGLCFLAFRFGLRLASEPSDEDIS